MAEIKLQHIFPAYNQGNKAMIYVGRRQAQMAKEHTRIFNAIEARDPIAAERCMRDHIARVRSEIQTQPDGH